MLNQKKLFTKILNGPVFHSVEAASAMMKNVSGGYYQFGKVVIVNAQLYVDGTFPTNDYFTALKTFPIPSVLAALTVTYNPLNRSTSATAVIDSSGNCVIQSGAYSALSNSTLYVTGCYIAQ